MMLLAVMYILSTTKPSAASVQAPIEVPKPWKTLLQEDLVERVTFSPDGRFLAVDVVDRGRGMPWHVNLYSTRDWRLRRVLRRQCLPAYSADSRYLVTCSVKREDYDQPAVVTVWRGPHWRRVGRLPSRIDDEVVVAPGATILTSRSKSSRDDLRHVVEAWDMATCRPIGRRILRCYGLFTWPRAGLVGVYGSSPRGRDRDVAQLMDYHSWRRLAKPAWVGCEVLAASSDGRAIAALRYGRSDRVHLLHSPSDTRERVLQERTRVDAAAFSPSGKWLATVGQEWATRLWDVASRRKVYLFSGGQEPVLSVAFSPDGKLLAVGGKDCAVWLWRVPKR